MGDRRRDYPFADAPDDNDPAVIRQRRIEHLEFLDKLHAQLPQVVRILLLAQDIHNASYSIGELLDVDFMEVQMRLSSISLFALTRTPTAARAERLEDMRRQQ
ncbi:MAG: hypothetical protein ACXWW7_09005 [Nocardioides sp.]